MEHTLYFDGLCEPRNPGGVATWGIVVLDGNNTIVHKDCGLACTPYTPQSTNNLAEYTALIRGLQWCLNNPCPITDLTVHGDSQLAIFQMTGRYAVRSPKIIPLYRAAKELAARFRSISFQWVRRDKNAAADEMSRIAYQRYQQSRQKRSAA